MTFRDARILDATDPRPVVNKILVVNAEEMPNDIFARHVRARHPELREDMKIALLKHHHHQAHQLIPQILDHFHDPARDPITMIESDA